MKHIKNLLLFFILSILIIACDSNYVPKPKGYFRIDLPERHYVKFDTTYPYTFEYPDYAKIMFRPDKEVNKYWMNLSFPCFRGELNVTYKALENFDDFKQYEKDTYEFMSKHVQKASSINDKVIKNDSAKVYGLVYEIEGIGAASSYQFFLTDSSKHFFRGALYFDARPNNDSLAPVISFVKEDLEHFIKTFRWK